MSRILVLGGYGGFGSAIAEQLRAEGHEVLVAGRSLERAEKFCGGRSGLVPLRIDRKDIATALCTYEPDAVVDASGPFQAMDHSVPRACIEAAIPYCDIADSTAYVCDIGLLDPAARSAGVPVLAGASSVPALSGAAIRELAEGMTHISAVEMAISASNRASAGPAVAAAILSQAGQRFTIGSGIAERLAFGWQERQRIAFAVPGATSLANRSVYLVNVPDVRLVPERLTGAPPVSFRAGTELAFQNRILWLMSWLVRWRVLASLAPMARWIAPLQRITAGFGGARSAMIVRLFGIADGRRVERRWTLIAERGDGPRIPALTVPLLIRRMLAGTLPPGARDAGQELTLKDYEPAFAGLAIRHASEELAQPDALYRRVMGSGFDALPKAVQQMHSVLREGFADGEAEVFGATESGRQADCCACALSAAGSLRLARAIYRARRSGALAAQIRRPRFCQQFKPKGRLPGRAVWTLALPVQAVCRWTRLVDADAGVVGVATAVAAGPGAAFRRPRVGRGRLVSLRCADCAAADRPDRPLSRKVATAALILVSG